MPSAANTAASRAIPCAVMITRTGFQLPHAAMSLGGRKDYLATSTFLRPFTRCRSRVTTERHDRIAVTRDGRLCRTGQAL